MSISLWPLIGAVIVVVGAYLLAVWALGRVGEKYSFDPVYLTSNRMDKASLSQLQVFGFTLLVLGLLTYYLLVTRQLSDISPDILLLLGISAGGAIGSKITDTTKNRLSFENWAWLRHQGWLTVYEEGYSDSSQKTTQNARWGDLLKTGESFDIYKFQLAVFSLLVGIALLIGDLSQLAAFKIPEHILYLLGLSNVVYIGGKAIAPNAFGELDKKVSELRGAERRWTAKIDSDTRSLPPGEEKLEKAKQEAPQEYDSYITIAREAARMLQAVYVKENDTKFKIDLKDEELIPTSIIGKLPT